MGYHCHVMYIFRSTTHCAYICKLKTGLDLHVPYYIDYTVCRHWRYACHNCTGVLPEHVESARLTRRIISFLAVKTRTVSACCVVRPLLIEMLQLMGYFLLVKTPFCSQHSRVLKTDDKICNTVLFHIKLAQPRSINLRTSIVYFDLLYLRYFWENSI